MDMNPCTTSDQLLFLHGCKIFLQLDGSDVTFPQVAKADSAKVKNLLASLFAFPLFSILSSLCADNLLG